MIATVVSPGSIPEFVHPPVPGESHDFYGDTHLDSIKLPVPVAVHSPSTSAGSNSAQFVDPLAVDDILHMGYSTPASARNESMREPISGATLVAGPDQTEGSSDDILWAKLVDGCINGQPELVQEILTQSPQLKDSIDNISSATGMNPLHFAASRGHDEIVRVLIDQAGAGVDVQDREGETALLKASYSGFYSVVCFLLKRGANVHQRDKDGWTALHNASSKGFIDIAQVLLEKGEADINARSRMGHTPLINAASKGDIAMVLYFLNHARANPLLKNTFSEMAYDVAAANSEAYLCDILQSSEKQWWKEQYPADHIYDPLANHSTVLLTVHENQRASSSFPLSFMTPKFSASALAQQDIGGPWSLPNGRPSTKDDIHLPLLAASGASHARANMQRGWFWLTEWVIDRTDPNVDSEGWKYGKSLTDANQQWSGTPPTSGGNWVRRRKWIRVMKKRMDLISDRGDNSEADASQSQFSQELPGNYMKRADLALRPEEGFTNSEQELARYRQAIQILLNGVKVDKDPASKQSASTLLREYLLHAEELADAILQRDAALGSFQQLETPRPQIASSSSAGSAGSNNELRSLTLQKSRPADTETIEDLIESHSRHSADGLSEGTSESGLATVNNVLDVSGEDTNGALQEHNPDSESVLDQEQGEEPGAEFSAVTAASTMVNGSQEQASSDIPTQEYVPESEVTNGHSSASNIPIATSNHQAPEVAVLSASPAAPQADPFPVARLTRNPRSPTPSSSTRSNATHHSESHSTTGSMLSNQGGSNPSTTHVIHSSTEPVPTHTQDSTAAPTTFASPDRTSSTRIQSMQTPHHHVTQPPAVESKWELDHNANECRECHRKFSLWLRRHHCRRCGHVVCDRCSSHRAMLHPSMVVFDPTSSEAYLNHQVLARRGTVQSYRVCDSCYSTLGPGRSSSLNIGSGSVSSFASGSGSGTTTTQSNSGSQLQYQRSFQGHSSPYPTSHFANQASSAPVQNDEHMGVYMHSSGYAPGRSHSSSRSSSSSNLHPAPMVRNASSSSLMSECPVCGSILAGMEGGKAAQEAHVQDCLEGKSGQGSGPVRYIVYKLPADSPLIDQECAICFEEFVAGRTVARLNCLCTYHRHCIHSWLQHGNSCPVHYR